MNSIFQSRTLILALAICAAGMGTACKKKVKAVVPPTPKVQPIIVEKLPEETIPQAMPEPNRPAIEVSQQPQEKPKSKPRRAARKPNPPAQSTAQPTQQASNNPRTPTQPTAKPPEVVTEGGTNEPPPISAAVESDEARQYREETTRMVSNAEDVLRRLGAGFNDAQQAVARDVRRFIDQSKAATAAGDLVRAHNLALKAHLLADDLAKR